ncbi:MAG: hypothetical protein ACE5EO_03715 [Candidatus Krumholzibacteriia bacterium]
MLNGTSGAVKFILSILFFPMFFQNAFMRFAWGIGDQAWLMLAKRLFLLLPVCAIIVGCWASVACLMTVPVRQNRREFVTKLFITWWDLGKSIFSFWGGVFKMVLNVFAAALGLLRFAVLGLWSIVQDVLLAPFEFIRRVAQQVVSSPIPWIAVFLTLGWCAIETTIFTYVMSPLVVDTFSNITGEQLSEAFIRIPLYIFLLFIVLGSYAVLSNLVDSVKGRSASSIFGIGAIEIVVLFVEVVFLYREFVDSLVPWFAQYSENFELGVFWTLAIACFVWFGIRSLSWFLFAAHGTPTILAVIQGKGVKMSGRSKRPKNQFLEISSGFWSKMKTETPWIQAKGEELLASFILPPLQIIAAGLNFLTLLVITSHLFPLPFKNMEAITYSENLLKNMSDKSSALKPSPARAPRQQPAPKPAAPAFEPESPEPVVSSYNREGDSSDDA